MKKTAIPLLLTLTIVLSILAGCSKETGNFEDANSGSTRVGFSYKLPKQWKNNTIRSTTISHTGNIFADVGFYYCTEENMKVLSSPEFQGNTWEYTIPIAKVILTKPENAQGGDVEALKAIYNQSRDLGENSGYQYTLLWEYNGDMSAVDEANRPDYDNRLSLVPDLADSVSFQNFDPQPLIEEAIDISNTLTFETTTLEGDPVTSDIFGKYDMTVVNLWGTYCYPNIDETETLGALNAEIANMKNVNFLQIVIDTPDPTAEQQARDIKNEKKVEFMSILPTESIAGWIISNLEGVPTTIFVNKKGIVKGEQVKGIHDLEFYKEEINKRLPEMKKTN